MSAKKLKEVHELKNSEDISKHMSNKQIEARNRITEDLVILIKTELEYKEIKAFLRSKYSTYISEEETERLKLA